jgi:hypothetical protein
MYCILFVYVTRLIADVAHDVANDIKLTCPFI